MTAGPPALTWIIGAGGLLGGAVTRAAAARGLPLLENKRVPWGDPDRADAALTAGAQALLAAAAGRPWRVIWCAGSGVTSSHQRTLAREVDALGTLLSALEQHGAGEDGGVFISSSAGGVYAGGPTAPFTECHPVAPVSSYGKAKLAGERLAGGFHARTGTPVVLARLSNIYGPGQNLAKPQGLISALCRAQLERQPASIYVPLDTIRDYLYVADAAEMVLDSMAGCGGRGLVTKIFASGHGVTIGTLLGELRRAFKRRPLVVMGTSPNARLQAADLRLRSVVWPELDRRTLTPLPVGLAATAHALQRRTQRAG